MSVGGSLPGRRTPVSDRVISLGSGLAAIPERLLLAHARGEVLFIAGAGISKPAGLGNLRFPMPVFSKRYEVLMTRYGHTQPKRSKSFFAMSQLGTMR